MVSAARRERRAGVFLFSSPLTPSARSVFRWEEGGQQVYVSGDWDNFASKKLLVRSKSAHTLVLEIPPGQHRYRFEVDGRWAADASKPLSSNVRGEQFNMLTAEEVGEFAVVAAPTEASSPPGEYSQDIREPPPNPRNAKRKNPNDPPMLPPHLLRALLNTAPNNANPLLLPLPHHVMLNHLYINKSREKDGIYIHGVTCRYRTKYVTTVLYKAI